jgi:DNA helicase-2/ATP-dependent DNA helicase PcrA
MIDGWKNKGLGPADIAEATPAPSPTARAAKLYAAYQERLKTLNACDFGDLLMHPIAIFRAIPMCCKDYHSRFRYILVDEYQDTNTAQYMWLRLLPSAPRASRRTSAASATTTSRSMAGAAPRSTTSCASRRIFPAPR